jgi:hypothetical protein
VQRLKSRDYDSQQLRDNRSGDVGHDAQSKNGKLQQCTTAEEIYQLIQTTCGIGLSQTSLHILIIHIWGRDE